MWSYSTHSKKYRMVKIKKWRIDLSPHALSEASSFTVKAPTFINGQGTFAKPNKFPFDHCCYVNCLFFLWTPSIGAHRSPSESPRANHQVPPGSPALFFNPVFCVTGQSAPQMQRLERLARSQRWSIQRAGMQCNAAIYFRNSWSQKVGCDCPLGKLPDGPGPGVHVSLSGHIQTEMQGPVANVQVAVGNRSKDN